MFRGLVNIWNSGYIFRYNSVIPIPPLVFDSRLVSVLQAAKLIGGRGCSFNCKIAIDALGIARSGFEKLFDDAVFPSTLKVVFVRLNMDSEQAGAVWSEFVANIIEGIDGSVFPRLNG